MRSHFRSVLPEPAYIYSPAMLFKAKEFDLGGIDFKRMATCTVRGQLLRLIHNGAYKEHHASTYDVNTTTFSSFDVSGAIWLSIWPSQGDYNFRACAAHVAWVCPWVCLVVSVHSVTWC